MRRIRKAYKQPKKAWDLARIRDDKTLMKNHGLRRKRELLRAEGVLRRFRQRARELIGEEDKEKEKVLIDKLSSMGMLKKGVGLDDVLALGVDDLLERRLQTVLLRKGLAKTISQSRQMIVHGHVSVDGKRVRFPSYMVPLEEENKISPLKEKAGGR